MSIQDAMERKDTYEEYYDRREARLQKLAQVIEQWGRDHDDGTTQAAVDDYYEDVGRLKARLEATRHSLRELRERDDWRSLRADIDDAISELEDAIGQAAPRYQ